MKKPNSTLKLIEKRLQEETNRRIWLSFGILPIDIKFLEHGAKNLPERPFIKKALSMKKPNRQKVTSARLSKFWCKSCDAQLVSEGVKCANCGTRNGLRRNKK